MGKAVLSLLSANGIKLSTALQWLGCAQVPAKTSAKRTSHPTTGLCGNKAFHRDDFSSTRLPLRSHLHIETKLFGTVCGSMRLLNSHTAKAQRRQLLPQSFGNVMHLLDRRALSTPCKKSVLPGMQARSMTATVLESVRMYNRITSTYFLHGTNEKAVCLVNLRPKAKHPRFFI